MAPKPTQTLSQAFEAMGVPYDAREGLTALAVAQNVAYSLPLPTELQGDVDAYYTEQCLPIAREAIGNFNESSVLDINYALLIAKLYWECRYKVLFCPQSPEALQAITCMVEQKLGQIPGPQVTTESLHSLDPDGPYHELVPTLRGFLGLPQEA